MERRGRGRSLPLSPPSHVDQPHPRNEERTHKKVEKGNLGTVLPVHTTPLFLLPRFLSAAKPADQREESVVLSLGLEGGLLSNPPCTVFWGASRENFSKWVHQCHVFIFSNLVSRKVFSLDVPSFSKNYVKKYFWNQRRRLEKGFLSCSEGVTKPTHTTHRNKEERNFSVEPPCTEEKGRQGERTNPLIKGTPGKVSRAEADCISFSHVPIHVPSRPEAYTVHNTRAIVWRQLKFLLLDSRLLPLRRVRERHDGRAPGHRPPKPGLPAAAEVRETRAMTQRQETHAFFSLSGQVQLGEV